MQYRREVDGLRAIAVLPVILFHAGFSWFSGGYVGVDVFFVISGYLITSILLKDLDSGQFSIVKFYERRAKRILPALLLVIVVTIPFAWLWFLPSQYEVFSQSVVATSLFASNVFFWKKSGYFEPSAEDNPLLHTWSLAVEEQFYIVFPVLLFLLWRFGKNKAAQVIFGISLLSLALSEYAWREYPSANFYLLVTRAWELGFGALCALYLFGRSVKNSSFFAALGLCLIVFSVFFYDKNTPFPSLYGLVPVVGTMLVLVFGGPKTLVAKLLSINVLVGLGLISYSAYLWHQPIFAFFRVKSVGDLMPMTMLLLSFASLGLAYLTWRFVETPFRMGSIWVYRSRSNVFRSSSVALLVLICFGLFGHFNHGVAWRDVGMRVLSYEPDNTKLQRSSWDILKRLTGSESYSVSDNEEDKSSWFYGALPGVKVLIVGNSHSKDVFNVIYNSEYVHEGVSISRYGVQVSELVSKDHEFFRSNNFLKSDVVLIASRYSYEDITSLTRVVDNLTASGKKVALAKNVFEFPDFAGDRNLADIVLQEHGEETDLVSHSDAVSAEINESYYLKYLSGETADKVLAANAKIDTLRDKVTVLDRMEYICSTSEEKCFAINEKYEKYFYDYGHHTLVGAEFFGKRLKDVGWLEDLAENSGKFVARGR